MARLIVLGMLLLALIPLARDEKTWQFFAPKEKTSQTRVKDLQKVATQDESKGQAATKPAATKPAATKPAAPNPEAPNPGGPAQASPSSPEPGPTDLDSEEREAALEEFQAVSDRTIGMKPEEMVVYWRMFAWTKSQTFAEMNRRAKAEAKQPTFGELMASPDLWRGVIVSKELHVRRILKYDAPANPYGIETVYELVGWADESKGWLHYVLTYELPPDMPVGESIDETVRVAGYFLKQQGYLEAGARPRDKPLAAPLLIGRVDWKPSPLAAEAARRSDWALLASIGRYIRPYWWIGAIVIIYLVLRLLLPRLLRGNRPATIEQPIARRTGAGWLEHDEDRGNLSNWLNDAQSGKLAERPVDAQLVNESSLHAKAPIAQNGHGAYPFGNGNNFSNN